MLKDDPDISNQDYQPPVHKLCSVCHYVTSQSNLLDVIARNAGETGLLSERWRHHESIEHLLSSAIMGCHLCSLLYTSCCTETFELPDDIVYQTPLVIGIHLDSTLHNDWELVLEQSLNTEYRTTLSSCDPQALDRVWRLTEGAWRTRSTRSEETLELARKWLESCQNTHELCNRRCFPRELPKRLLRVSGNYTDPAIVLIEVANAENSALTYLTLSHCWGPRPLFRLTKSVHQSFGKDIPFENLSETFRDAVQITLRLGHQYLWVDALCIIQDDDNDKAAEIPRMGTIYGNSVCTIAALSSKSGDGGCFAPRIPLSHMICRLSTKSGAVVALRSSRISGIVDTVHPTGPVKARYAPYLQQRAWVVQERALSPRTLYFSSIGIHWECCHSVTSEMSWCRHGSHLDSTLEEIEVGKLKLGIGGILRGFHTSSATVLLPSPRNWYTQWWHLVSVYSGRKLTHMTDRWSAMAGIAHMFEKTVGSKLVAGLWDAEIRYDMMWTTKGTTGDGGLRSRLDNGYPTWSWLSFDGWATLGSPSSVLTQDNCTLSHISYPSNRPGRYYLEVEGPMLQIPQRKDLRIQQMSGFGDTYLWKPVATQLDLLRRELCRGAWRADVPLSVHGDEAKWSSDWMEHHETWALQCTKQMDSVRMIIVQKDKKDPSYWNRLGFYDFDADEAGEDVILGTIGDRKRIVLR